MKKLQWILITAFMLTISTANAQLSDVGKFFAGGVDDAELLLEGYLSPYFNAFGTSLTAGWYNTAKTHKLGGFDVTATFNTVFIPSSDRSFDVSQIELSSLQVASADPKSPTIAGNKNPGPDMNYGPPVPSNTRAFTMPKGTGYSYVPSPMIQAGVGLIKDTEINGRFMPTWKSDDTEIGMWGIGFKHGLKQYIPFVKRIPVLHLTVQYGYTKLDGKAGIFVTPDLINADDRNTQGVVWDDQEMVFTTKSHTANLLVSANLPIFCFYGGIGFATTKTNVKLNGHYPMISDYDIDNNRAIVDDNGILENPLDLEFKYTDGKVTKPRLSAGLRLKFAVVTIHVDYTYASYSMASAGLGISFR